MKPQHYLTGLLIILALTLTIPSDAKAQYGPHHQPEWVAVHSCDVDTRYVYFPDHNIYYDMHRASYIYLSGPNWVFSTVLPQRFIHIDFGLAPIVELDILVDRPYIYNHHHINWYRTYHDDYHYARYYRGHGHGKHYDKHFRGDYAGYNHGKHYKKGHGNHDSYRDYENRGNHREYGNNNGRGNHKGNNGNHKGHYKQNDNRSKGNYVNRGNDRQYKNDKGSYAKRESNQRSTRTGNGRGR